MTNAPDIFTRLKCSRNLPTLPQVLLRLVEACNDEGCSPQSLSEITFKDPAISSKVLQLVNSAYTGLNGKITTLEKAIVYLGANTIKNIAISASVLHVFSHMRGNEWLNLPAFWWHSLMCASISKAIAIETAYPSPEEAFLSGLLHDIGKLVLWTNFREEYTEVLKEANGDTARLLAGEKTLGAPHHEVGAWLVRQWKLNSFMADAIFYHHRPIGQVAEALPLVKIIYAANLMSRRREEIPATTVTAAGGMVDLESEKLESITRQAGKEIQALARSLGIPLAAPGIDAQPDEAMGKAAGEALITEVKTFSLVYGTLQNLLEATSREEILKIAEQGFSILFDVPRVLFFLYDDRKNALIGQAVPGNSSSQLIDQLPIVLNGRRSIFATVFHGKSAPNTVFPSNERPLSIGESQILRLLEADRMLCLPIRVHGKPIGMIVAGFHDQQVDGFFKKKKILDLFLGHVGMCLHTEKIQQHQTLLVQEERIKASTSLSRKVVHEVNNPLGIIKNYLKILGLKLPEKHPAQNELSIIGEEIDRVGLMIRQLNDFSHPRAAGRAPVDVNTLLADMLQLLKDPLLRPAMIETQFSPDKNAPPIISEKNSLKQVFINLIKNAVEAMHEGGQLMISTRYVPDAQPDRAEGTDGSTGNLDITIKDNGPGIPESIRERLFEPFVSSKKQGRGLGLSIVHGIIRELNGTITCHSSIGSGTTFTITLPVSGRGI
ncbi:MAG: HDOD domain-containing protein [Desulfobacterales bacterium]|nr:HDOD domain-containing protein [Desulfobacterales bacterium]